MNAAEIIGRIIQEMYAYDVVLPAKFCAIYGSEESEPDEVQYDALIPALVEVANFIEKSAPESITLECKFEIIPMVTVKGWKDGEWISAVSLMP